MTCAQLVLEYSSNTKDLNFLSVRGATGRLRLAGTVILSFLARRRVGGLERRWGAAASHLNLCCSCMRTEILSIGEGPRLHGSGDEVGMEQRDASLPCLSHRLRVASDRLLAREHERDLLVDSVVDLASVGRDEVLELLLAEVEAAGTQREAEPSQDGASALGGQPRGSAYHPPLLFTTTTYYYLQLLQTTTY